MGLRSGEEIAPPETTSAYQHLVDQVAVRDRPSGCVGWTRTAPERPAEVLVLLGFTRPDLDPPGDCRAA